MSSAKLTDSDYYVREFLKDHPEFIPDCKRVGIGGREEVCLTTQAKADQLRKGIRDDFG